MDTTINNLNLFHDDINSISGEDKEDMNEKQLEINEEQMRETQVEDEKKEEEEVINNNNDENINNNNNTKDELDAKCHDTVLPNHTNVINNFASIETMLNNHTQFNKDSNYNSNNTNSSPDSHRRSESDSHRSDSNRSDGIKWWHPHVYANPPKMPTPFFITNILGISNSNSSNCYEFPGSPSDRNSASEGKSDEPLNLCVKNKSGSFDIHGHVGRKTSLNSSFSSRLKIKGKLNHFLSLLPLA